MHNPTDSGCADFSAVHAVAVTGLRLVGNAAYRGANAHVRPVALISTGTNASRYWVRGVSWAANAPSFDPMRVLHGTPRQQCPLR